MLFRRQQPEAEPLAFRLFGATLGSVVLFLVEIVQIVIIAAAIIIPIRYFLIQPFIVNGASMEPNYFDSEYLIIDQITYDFRDIERGEVVVFRPPNGSTQFYIKRVVGLPGETVEIDNGEVIIYNEEFPNGQVLEETYLDEETLGRDKVTLGLNEYYLMGDNRDSSLDSRKFGPVKESAIIGKVLFRGLPLERMGMVKNPEYNL